MVFINEKLGNAFRIKPVDSSVDNDHYFGGHTKHTGYSVRFMSGTGGTYDSDDYAFSDDGLITVINANGNSYEFSGTLWDQTNVNLERNDSFFDFYLANGSSTATTKMTARLSVEISSSLASTTPAAIRGEMVLEYRDGYIWETALDFLGAGSGVSLSDGWVRFEKVFSFVSGSDATEFPMNLLAPDDTKGVYITMVGTDNSGVPVSSSFRKFRLDFVEPLNNEGVEYYRTVDNQHIEFNYLNTDAMKKVE